MEIQIRPKTTPINKGYNNRIRTLRAIIIHTTNGKIGTTYEDELAYLRKSPLVGAHYLVGKEGQVTQLLNPFVYSAWHTGATINPFDSNQYTIGIENHFTPGETWTAAMWKALTDLVLSLPQLPLKTHREIAFPPGRKKDPSGVTDEWFAAWKKNLPLMGVYATWSANIRNVPIVNGISKIRTLPKDTHVFGFFVKGQNTHGSDLWLRTQDGYIHKSGLQ